MPRSSGESIGGRNIAAALDMIAWSELGAKLLKATDDGYNVIVGSTPQNPILFTDYSKHPNLKQTFTYKNGQTDESTAAGRYQILYRFALAYIKQLGLPDFGPESQDKIAVQLIKECNAFKLFQDGMFNTALNKIRSRWASLPGAGYNQHEQKVEILTNIYTVRGGIVND